MKNIFLASALALCVTSAFAADPSAVLKVKGTLTNAACTPTLSGGGTVDYGTLNVATMSSTAVNQLGRKNLDLAISCSSTTKVGFTVVDDRADSNANVNVENARFDGSATAYSTFGLGNTAGNVKIGSYTISIKTDSVTADGKSVDSIFGNNPSTGIWFENNSSGRIGPMPNDMYTVSTSGSLEPLAIQNVTIPLIVSAAVQDTTKLAITDDTALDGQATVSIIYL